jgi:hypothetical protein
VKPGDTEVLPLHPPGENQGAPAGILS